MRLLMFNLATDADDPILGFTTRWIAALAEQVEFIYVITMRAGRIDAPSNVRVLSVGKEKGYSEPRRALEFYRHLLGVLRFNCIDACFSHMIPVFTIMAAPILKAKGIPIVTWYGHPSLNWKLKVAHHLSDRMVTSVETAYPYRRDKLVVIGQGIDTELFAPKNAVPEKPPLILCVGRLSPVKDHPTLLKAVALLRKQVDHPFQVVILGGPARAQDYAYIQSLQALVHRLGLQDCVRFNPPVPQPELPRWYRRCTVHVNLTPTGFGDKVALEAMACARPCLTANEGFRETLGRFADQLLFRCGDSIELAEKLRWLLSLSDNEREAIGQYLRERIIRFHSLESLVGKLVRLLEELAR
ncbi:MAG: hypothetical protein DRI61_03900 [Chloroflexi bacterium]|nr:MAG: hypothetical protein DRI61_03900 [Chloroflexota bacterium]